MFQLARRLRRALSRPPLPLSKAAGRLLCVTGPDAGCGYHLDGAPTLIGRDPAAAIRLHGKGVSRRHARVHHDGDSFVLEDLGSRNGVRVNGKVATRHELRVGDQIQIGHTMLVWAPR
jgi:pSer/pThr/pTyr-binding forkhead associated (FHA) protein